MEREQAERLIRDWFAEALKAVDPVSAVERAVATIPTLVESPPPVVLAIGKAAGPMTAGLASSLPRGIDRGIAITKDLRTVGRLPSSVKVFEAGHPIPDQRTISATEAALAMLSSASPEQPVVVLISGGGSALLEAPVAGVSLADIATLTGAMLRAGASINELNAVRSRLSRVKQGGLLSYINDDRPTTLVLSDVIGNDLSVIASGPTVLGRGVDPPRLILDRMGLWSNVAESLRDHIDATPTDIGDTTNSLIFIVADNNTAVDAFAAAARGHTTVDVTWRQRTGEARDLAVEWVAVCIAAPNDVDVLVGGGEATVTVGGDGIGGRNTEFAVAAAIELDRQGYDDWIIASLATDGDDGPTGAAGGIVSRATVPVARDAGLDAAKSLESNDTLRILESAGGLVLTGPTGTNVNDLYVAVRVR